MRMTFFWIQLTICLSAGECRFLMFRKVKLHSKHVYKNDLKILWKKVIKGPLVYDIVLKNMYVTYMLVDSLKTPVGSESLCHADRWHMLSSSKQASVIFVREKTSVEWLLKVKHTGGQFLQILGNILHIFLTVQEGTYPRAHPVRLFAFRLHFNE